MGFVVVVSMVLLAAAVVLIAEGAAKVVAVAVVVTHRLPSTNTLKKLLQAENNYTYHQSYTCMYIIQIICYEHLVER